MPYTTVTSGTTITAAWANANVRDQVVTPFAGTSARSSAITSPIEGMATYDTTNDRFEIYTTTTTGWVAPWNMPWGVVGRATVTANQTSIGTSVTDLTSLTTTFTAIANRIYKISAHAVYDSNTVATQHNLFVRNGGGTQLALAAYVPPSTGCITTYPITAYAAASGSTTIKLSASCSSGTFSLVASATNPAFLIVEDIGPSAAPA